MTTRPDDPHGTPRPGAEPPPDPRPVTQWDHTGPAAGMGAVWSIAKQGWRELGVVRSLHMLRAINQKEGFDCPGCAWPDPMDRTPFEFCENGMKAITEEASPKTVGPDFFAQHSVADLTHWTDHALGKAGRLTHPMILRDGATHYEPIAWDAAFERIADALTSLDHPDQAVFYTSGRTSNEAAFAYQLFVRRFGTNNLPDCSNMCHESSGRGMGEVLGSGKGSVTLDDFEKSDAIFIFGQNPGTNHPRMMTSLQAAKRAGATIVTINPLKEPGLMGFTHPQEVGELLKGKGTDLTDLYLQVRVNGDVAFLTGLMKDLLERPEPVLDQTFIDEHTDGFEAFADSLRAADWQDVVAGSGLNRDQIRAAADIYARSKATICCWAMGVTQHKNAVGNIQMICNLLMLKGNLGIPGAGPCPVRGHSNVQGDRTMGIWERPSQAFLDRIEASFGFRPPQEHGLDVVGAIQAMHSGTAKVFLALGGNFLSATPDTAFTAAALSRTDLTIQISTKLNRSHLITGKEALILPCLGRTEIDVQRGREQFVTVENSMGYVHTSRGRLPPASPQLLSEPRIVCRLAESVLGPNSPVRWPAWAEDYDRIRNGIAKTIPGFEDMNTRVRRSRGFLLPHPVRERRFPTATNTARFTVHAIPPEVLRDGQLMMMTIRSHDQFNTTIYGYEDRYRGLSGNRRVVLMHPEDMAERGLKPHARIDLTSHFQGVERHARGWIAVPYDIPRRCVATYFPEANVLVPVDHFADKSRTPASKSVAVSVSPVAGGDHGPR